MARTPSVMRLGILSDTHNRLERVLAAVALLKSHKVSTLVHCGDVTDPEILGALVSPHSVLCLGNNDLQRKALETEAARLGIQFLGDGGTFRAGNCTIAVTHGHLKKL